VGASKPETSLAEPNCIRLGMAKRTKGGEGRLGERKKQTKKILQE